MDNVIPICSLMFVLSLLSVNCQDNRQAFIRMGEAMKNQTRTVGGTVKFKCTVTAYPLPMYTWYKDGERINAGFKTVKSGSRLLLRNLKVTDSGHYACQAMNVYGIVSSNAYLVVKPAPGSMPQDVTAVAVDRDPMAVTLNWQPPQKSNGQINGYLIFYTTVPSKDDVEWVVEAVLGEKLSTTITELTEDTTYYFKVQSRDSKGYGQKSKTVSYKTPKHGENPYFEETHLTVTTTVGSPVTLPCKVHNIGKYKIAWIDPYSLILTFEDRRIIDDNRISIERPYITDWNLMIRDVGLSDQGNYTCQINTHPIKSIIVTLKVEDNQNNQEMNTIVTKTQLFPGIVLRCEYPDMTSSLTFGWTRNGHPLNEFESFNISYTQNSSTLEIFRLRGTVYDLVYTCVVKDMENGSVITSANFTWTDMYSDRCAEKKFNLCISMGFGRAFVPNYLSPQNSGDAALQINQFLPLVRVGCSEALQPFLCYLYAPPCGDALRLPCRSMCLEARQGCEPVMTKFGYNWPVLFDCMTFPEDNCWTSYNATTEPRVVESNGSCVKNELPMCKDIGIRVYIQHNRTIGQIGKTLSQFMPLVKTQCSLVLRPFLCYTYAPPCPGPRPPCRKLCEEARRGCEPLMRKFAMDWPDYLDCMGLPEKDCIGTWQSTDHDYPPHMDNGSHFLGLLEGHWQHQSYNASTTKMATLSIQTTQSPPKIVKSVRGGGRIFIKGNSSTYIRDNIRYDDYKQVTRDLYIHHGNFDMVWIEGRLVGDCPRGLNECYVMQFERYEKNANMELAFAHVDDFNKARIQL